jgi:hypothetical protein
VALPSTTATRLRVRLAVGEQPETGFCVTGGRMAQMNWAAMAVVGPKGEASSLVKLTCDGVMADHVIDLPNASPLWFTVFVEGARPEPSMGRTMSAPSVLIDEMELM